MKIKERTKEIIALLIEGNTQWVIYKMGYPFGTVRYHHAKLFKPKQFKKTRDKQKLKAKQKRTCQKNKKL